jgi:phosphopantothenoylcysteine decarboxylase/phosphopantothenate--cysteine ligase
VTSAAEMEAAVLQACQKADILLMAAAVADFRPVQAEKQKIKKQSGLPKLELERTTDILSAVAEQRLQSKRPRIMVGFAAETQDLLANARTKLKAKHLDLIVANNVSDPDSGFTVDTNRVTLLRLDGQTVPLPLLTKDEVADRVISEVITLLIE